MQASSPFSDEELLRRIAGGDERAFTSFYRERQGGIYRFALQMCGSASVAEDVTQEVFMALIREAHRFDPARGNLVSYLYGMARNQVRRRLEKDRALLSNAEEADDETAHDEACGTPHDPLDELTRRELIASVRQAVLALPEHYREVVVLCELHEMSYAEAAGVLGCAVGTVRSRLHRARGLLVERLRAVRDAEAEGDKRPQAVTQRCFV